MCPKSELTKINLLILKEPRKMIYEVVEKDSRFHYDILMREFVGLVSVNNIIQMFKISIELCPKNGCLFIYYIS